LSKIENTFSPTQGPRIDRRADFHSVGDLQRWSVEFPLGIVRRQRATIETIDVAGPSKMSKCGIANHSREILFRQKLGHEHFDAFHAVIFRCGLPPSVCIAARPWSAPWVVPSRMSSQLPRRIVSRVASYKASRTDHTVFQPNSILRPWHVQRMIAAHTRTRLKIPQRSAMDKPTQPRPGRASIEDDHRLLKSTSSW